MIKRRKHIRDHDGGPPWSSQSDLSVRGCSNIDAGSGSGVENCLSVQRSLAAQSLYLAPHKFYFAFYLCTTQEEVPESLWRHTWTLGGHHPRSQEAVTEREAVQQKCGLPGHSPHCQGTTSLQQPRASLDVFSWPPSLYVQQCMVYSQCFVPVYFLFVTVTSCCGEVE